jgi:hypothetical protein
VGIESTGSTRWFAEMQAELGHELEDFSGGRQRCGHLTKQGNRLTRFLLVEAAEVASR